MAQVRDLCETYMSVSKRSGKRPKMYLSHIAGIYDDYLQNYVKKHNIDIYPDILMQGGLSIVRKAYQYLRENHYPITLIGGGARGLHHFTEMIGGDCVVTINWRGTADVLLKEDPPVVWRLFNPVPKHVIEELSAKLPDYRRGYIDNGLGVDDYEEFGPVELFRSSFVGSWKRVLGLIAEMRKASA
jgi:transaldolase